MDARSEHREAETCFIPLTLQGDRRMASEAGQKWRQYMAAGAANLGILALGMCMGWTSPTLPKLTSGDGSPLDRPIDSDEESWVGSLITLGAAVGPLYTGVAADKFGRKYTILAGGIPLIIGWILVATATSVEQLYMARIIWGLAVGQLFTGVPMYVGEIAEKEVRGALGSFLQMFIVVGFLITYTVGPFVSYLTLSIVSIVPGVLFILAFFFMPESPSYLITHGRTEDAIASLKKLRGKSANGIQQELQELQIAAEQNTQTASISDLWTSTGNFKALYLSCGLVALQQLSGINVVLFYMETIFQKANTGLEPYLSTIIIGIVQVLASSVTPLVVDRLGRRMLLIISALGMTVALFLLGLFFLLDNMGSSAVSSLTWLPVLSLIIFMCVYCVGFGPLPWAVMGELFEPSVKSVASTVATTFCWVIGFILTKYFSALQEAIGIHYAFWIFGLFTLSGFFFVYFLLPETKGKSLQEIQDILNNRRSVITQKV